MPGKDPADRRRKEEPGPAEMEADYSAEYDADFGADFDAEFGADFGADFSADIVTSGGEEDSPGC